MELDDGEPFTVGALYAEQRDWLLRHAISLTHDIARADDLVQDTFIVSFSHLELLSRLDLHQRRAWLSRVLRNRFFDQLRAQRRHQVILEQMAYQESLADAGDRASGAFLPYVLFELVPPRYRDLLRKRYMLGMSSEEIARQLGVPPATVRSRLRLAINWLRIHQREFT